MIFDSKPLLLRKIYLDTENKINVNDILRAMQTCYKHLNFSTFGYKKMKENNSKLVMGRYLSGNCISLSIFIQSYLQENHKAKSYIICACVPKINKVDNTPHACHCALLVPLDQFKFAIVDCAFNFKSPMICSINELNISHTAHMCDVYAHDEVNVDYALKTCKSTNIDDIFNQHILPDTLCVRCNYTETPDQYWNYYLNEVLNPDDSIGSHYMNNLGKDILLHTSIDNITNKIYMNNKLTFQDGVYILKSYPSYNSSSYNNVNELYDAIRGDHNLYFAVKRVT